MGKEVRERIEGIITNGLGYVPIVVEYLTNRNVKQHKTNFTYQLIDENGKSGEKKDLGSAIIDLSEIHDTYEGLQIHLGEMNYKINLSNELRRVLDDYKKLVINKYTEPFNTMLDECFEISFTNFDLEEAKIRAG